MKKIFINSMTIGAMFEEKYYNDERTEDWCGSEECSTMTKKTIDYAKENNVSLECALDIVMNKLLENDFDTIEDHMWDDYCRGFLAGEIIGMPTDENLKMVRKAEKLWKDDCYGYYQDVLDEVCEY